MTTVPDIPVVQLPALDGEARDSSPIAQGGVWALDVPSRRRLAPVALAALGVLAGVAAMVVGGAAVVFAGSTSEHPAPVTDEATVAPPVTPALPDVERQVLSLLAKPSTERVAFRGARGLVLAVGSGGRAAILIRGLGRAGQDLRYTAWIVRPDASPVRAGGFVATERAVFLTRPLGPQASVVVSIGRPAVGPRARNRIVALRG